MLVNSVLTWSALTITKAHFEDFVKRNGEVYTKDEFDSRVKNEQIDMLVKLGEQIREMADNATHPSVAKIYIKASKVVYNYMYHSLK
jgi:hypothetical protein